MNKRKTGAVLWLAGLLSFPFQIIAASRWLEAYSYRSNAISDLGVTTCGVFDEGARVERYICSPWHDLANAATIGNGMLIALGAVLLWNVWPRPGSGRTAMALMAVGGLLVLGVGVFPWDTHPDEHNLTAILQVLFQWGGMVFLLISVRRTSLWHLVGWVTAFFLAVSISGFALFINAIGGGAAQELGMGISERIAFDSLTAWAALVGLLLFKPSLQGEDAAPVRLNGDVGADSSLSSTYRPHKD